MAATAKVEVCEISRGESAEVRANFNDLRNYEVQDEYGTKAKFGELFSCKKTIVILIRHLLCFTAKEYVDDLATIPKTCLDEAAVNLVLVGCAPTKFMRQFRKDTGYSYAFYTDPERGLYKLLGCHAKTTIGRLTSSKHVKSGPISGVLTSTWRALTFPGEWQGDLDQLGASLVIGPGDVIHFSHIDQNASDHAPINELLRAAGVKPVNFAKDRIVYDV